VSARNYTNNFKTKEFQKSKMKKKGKKKQTNKMLMIINICASHLLFGEEEKKMKINKNMTTRYTERPSGRGSQ
jgi:hypothetical protein